MSVSTRARYEITASHPDGRCYLVAYAARTSRMGLYDAIQSRAELIIKKLGLPEDVRFGDDGAKPRAWTTLGDWTVKFTGRTQNDVKMQDNAHPYVGAAD